MMPSFTWKLENGSHTTVDFFTPYPDHWRKWEIASCEEWNSGHDWTVAILVDETCSTVDVYCANCPLNVDYLYGDYSDLIYGQLDNITIDAGSHNSTEDKIFKVNVELHVEKYGWEYPEYDVWVELTLRD